MTISQTLLMLGYPVLVIYLLKTFLLKNVLVFILKNIFLFILDSPMIETNQNKSVGLLKQTKIYPCCNCDAIEVSHYK